MPDTFEPLTTALRVWTVLHGQSPNGAERRKPRRLHGTRRRRYVVFDTETTIDRLQRFLYGCWREYNDSWSDAALTTCVVEGLIYVDDLPERDADGYACLLAYVESHRARTFPGRSRQIKLMSRTEFANRVIWKQVHDYGARLVGFNLPFDLARIALHAAPARGSRKGSTDKFLGGLSLRLWEFNGKDHPYRARIAMKNIDSKRTMIGFRNVRSAKDKAPFTGAFLDARTLTYALTDKPHTLESACAAFGVEFTKADVEHGTITEEHIDYCRADVAATALLTAALLAEYANLPVALPAERAISPAAIGKALLQAMGVPPVLERFPEFPDEVCGWAMAAFFGGRAECHITRTPVPVVYLDFLSMYSTVNALMGTWNLLTARTIDLDDATDEVRQLLARTDLAEHLSTPAGWNGLHCLVQIEPDGDILPVRANYDPAADSYSIGLNPYQADDAWYPLADLIDSRILGGPIPTIRRAVRLVPVGKITGTHRINLHGCTIDPRKDAFRSLIEARRQSNDPRWQRLLKVIANSIGYGILAEHTRGTLPADRPATVTVYTDLDEPFEAATLHPETPGDYCFPPAAACVTAAARLMLGLLQRNVTALGGTWAFCDTDSMAIVATETGGPVNPDDPSGMHALSWHDVQGIVDRFAALNPYDPIAVPGSILETEDENFDADGNRHQLWCYAISSKRYALYTQAPDGVRTMVKVSESGIGHLLNPTDAENPDRQWISAAWEWMIATDLGEHPDDPEWIDRPALSRLSVTGAEIWGWLETINSGLPYAEQTKPWNFLLVAYPDPLDPHDTAPIAPYERRPDRWQDLDWLDRHSGQPVGITTGPLDGMARSATRIRTISDVLAQYRAHPESPALGPDEAPVISITRGELRSRPVRAIEPNAYVGKEANQIAERQAGLVDHPDSYRTTYEHPSRTDWETLVLPVLRSMPRSDLVSKSGLSRSSIERLLKRRREPRGSNQRLLESIAANYAALRDENSSERDRRRLMRCYLDGIEARP